MTHLGQVHTRTRLVQGVGVNDAPFSIGGQKTRNPIYSLWKRMLGRCYGKPNKSNQSYVGCSVAEEWLSFMAFHDWVVLRGWEEGLHLDKDLLVPGNKVYGPNTCCLVPSYVNLIAVKANQPCIRVDNGRHAVMVCKDSKKIYLGTYDSAQEALEAWRAGKKSVIHAVIERYKTWYTPDQSVIEALEKLSANLTEKS